MVGSPASLVCHWMGGVPGWLFSQATLLVTGGVHGSVAARPEAGALSSTARAKRDPAMNEAKPGRAGRRAKVRGTATCIMRRLLLRDPRRRRARRRAGA